MAFKKPVAHASVPESPDWLFRDLPRRKHPSLFDHQGQILRRYVEEAVDASDVALQLPTGSGKTLVGLLLAEWRRKKFGDRVVYLCPTRQLVTQVTEEAVSKYGLSVEAFVGSARMYSPAAKSAYLDGERLAVTTYNSLFNVSPFFESPQVIILDDAHAAESYVASQWTFRVSRREPTDAVLFHAIAAVLKNVVTTSAWSRLTSPSPEVEDITWVDKLPTHTFVTIADELRQTIDQNIDDRDQRFAWRLLKDHLIACHLYISATEVEIRPLIPPTWTHGPFKNATQRIFMSATLGAGGDLERLTGRRKIYRLPIPAGWDRQGIGRRFFMFPEKSLDQSEATRLREQLMSSAGRSLVLTPSTEKAKGIAAEVRSTLRFPVFDAAELEASRSRFVGTQHAVAIVANRYDGIDFPDEDCRLLFVEGLPRAMNLQERFLMNRMGAHLLFNERVQTRVLQAVGRCTRGLNDYAAVVVTGEDLSVYLTDHRRRAFLHPELQAEIQFGIDQSSKVDPQAFLENFRIFIDHGAEWEEANQGILEARDRSTQSPFPAMEQLAKAVPHEIAWQSSIWSEDYSGAFEAAREVLGCLDDGALRGYRALWFYLAGSAAELASLHGESAMETQARAHYRKAKEAAVGVPWLIGLARGTTVEQASNERDEVTLMLQVEQLEAELARLGTLHNRTFSAREREIRDGLATTEQFECAQKLLGEHLGYLAGKEESDASPDPWWAIGDRIIVFEDHSNAKGPDAMIDATKARQAASHPDWIRAHVEGASTATIVAVLVTPATSAAAGAVPHLKNVCYWELQDFRAWAESALIAVRELRRTFTEPGDLVWRAQASEKLKAARADALGLTSWLSKRPATSFLKSPG